ncbi:MAG: hypothetical protein JNL98_36730 [Bryobacterales bacterium]|nr:hypothetical protein [Bryobacterales bacterium]
MKHLDGQQSGTLHGGQKGFLILDMKELLGSLGDTRGVPRQALLPVLAQAA